MVKKEMEVEDLPGVGKTTGEKLRLAGYDNLISIAVTTPKELVDVSGVTEATARKIIKASRENLDMGFKIASEVSDSKEKISTGSKALDSILGGGVEIGSITEFFGAYGSGKTQLAHFLSVMIQTMTEDGITVYIDTENTFRTKRIKDFAKGLGLDPEEALKRVKVARAYNTDHQMLLIDKAEELVKNGEKVKLLIVDSLTSHFRAEYVGRGTLAERQQKLNKHMHAIAKFADINNVAVLLTNQVMAKPDMFFGDPNAPIGGHIVGHNSTFRIYLLRKKDGVRKAKLVDAPDLPDNECEFKVDDELITDI
jgi:DNA repair protein RadA